MIKLKNIIMPDSKLEKKQKILNRADEILENLRLSEKIPLYESKEDMIQTRKTIMEEARKYCSEKLLNEVKQVIKSLES